MDKKNTQPAKKPDAEIKQPPVSSETAAVKIQQTSYQGPIPAPSIMQGYQKIDPGFPERIMRDFEKNSEHIRQSEELNLQATISERKRGQWMAFILSVLLLVIVGFSLWLGNTTFAGISGVAFIGLLIQSFISSRGNNKK